MDPIKAAFINRTFGAEGGPTVDARTSSRWLSGADFLEADRREADAYAAGHAEGMAEGLVLGAEGEVAALEEMRAINVEIGAKLRRFSETMYQALETSPLAVRDDPA